MSDDFILKLGYELEGGFNRDTSDDKKDDFFKFKRLKNLLKFEFGGDGSVRTKHRDGEVRSRVYKIKEKNDLKVITDDFKLISEFIKEINKSCGLHIHLSFNHLADYYALCSYDFVDKFMKAYEKKFKSDDEKDRLLNSFCKKYHDENDFKNFTKKSLRCRHKAFRYKAINYNAYNCFKTIEFRIFPSVKTEKKFKDYVYFLFDFVNSYLKKYSKKDDEKSLIMKNRLKTKTDKNDITEIRDTDIFNNEIEDEEKNKNVHTFHSDIKSYKYDRKKDTGNETRQGRELNDEDDVEYDEDGNEIDTHFNPFGERQAY